MNIDECKTILAVLQEGSLLKAGDKVGLTQPAVSRIVARVENKLGVPLFIKTKTPSWTLTNAGKIYVEKAKAFIAINSDLQCAIEALKQPQQGCLKLGVMDFEERNLLSKVLPAFHKLYPNYLVKVRNLLPKKIEYAILEREVDLGIIISPPVNDGLNCIDLAKREILLVLPRRHKLAKNYKRPKDNKSFPKINLKLLADVPFAIFPLKDHALGHISVKLCQKYGFAPKIIMEAERIHSIYSLVIAGHCAAFTLQGDEYFSKDLAYFKISDEEAVQTVAFAYKKNRKLLSVEKDFLQLLKDDIVSI